MDRQEVNMVLRTDRHQRFRLGDPVHLEVPPENIPAFHPETTELLFAPATQPGTTQPRTGTHPRPPWGWGTPYSIFSSCQGVRVARYREEHSGAQPGLSLDERARLREMEREVQELRMENEFLKKAAVHFAQDRP